MSNANKRILLILPEPLLVLTDRAAERFNVSRLTVVRQALIHYLAQLREQQGHWPNSGIAPFRVFSSMEIDHLE